MAMGVLVSVAWVHSNLSTEFGPGMQQRRAEGKQAKMDPDSNW